MRYGITTICFAIYCYKLNFYIGLIIVLTFLKENQDDTQADTI